jgi:hypothetical protein
MKLQLLMRALSWKLSGAFARELHERIVGAGLDLVLQAR